MIGEVLVSCVKSLLKSFSLEKAQSVSIINAPLKAAGVALFALASSTAIWAATAQVPIKINAIGVLTPVDGLYLYRSRSNGQVILPFRKSRISGRLEFESPLWAKTAYNYQQGQSQNYASDKKLAIEILKYIDELQSQRVPSTLFSAGSDLGGKYQIVLDDGDIVAIVDQPDLRQNLQNQITASEKTIISYNKILATKGDSFKTALKLSSTKQGLIAPIAGLLQKGYTSKYELLQAESDAASQKNNAYDIKSQLDDLKLQIQQQKIQLSQALSNFIQQSLIFSEDHSYLKSFMISQWEYVNPGTEIAAVGWSNMDDATVIPVFFDQKSATEINIGQKAILTPLGFSIAEVGGIVGEVVTLEPFPFTSNILAQRLKSQGLAQIVSPTGVSYQANIRLKRKDLETYKQQLSTNEKFKGDNRLRSIIGDTKTDNSGGYVWDNKSKPPIKPREGFILSAQITTRSSTPLQMMIPFLKELFGKAPVTKLVHTQINQP